jgi:hypothetical protein
VAHVTRTPVETGTRLPEFGLSGLTPEARERHEALNSIEKDGKITGMTLLPSKTYAEWVGGQYKVLDIVFSVEILTPNDSYTIDNFAYSTILFLSGRVIGPRLLVRDKISLMLLRYKEFTERMRQLQKMAFTDAVHNVIIGKFPNYIITERDNGGGDLAYMAYEEEPRYGLPASERKLKRNSFAQMLE